MEAEANFFQSWQECAPLSTHFDNLGTLISQLETEMEIDKLKEALVTMKTCVETVTRVLGPTGPGEGGHQDQAVPALRRVRRGQENRGEAPRRGRSGR